MKEWINIAAILLSPIIALLIAKYLQDRKAKRDYKLFIFAKLMETRHSPITDEAVRALNMVDVAFDKEEKVRQLWHEYFEMLHNQGLNNPSGFKSRQQKNLELITEMAKAVGYKKKITSLDVDRVYYPVGLGEASNKNQEIINELLRVLKATACLPVVEKKEDEKP